MGESKEFTIWAKMMASELATGKTLDQRVDEEMQAKHLRVEAKDAFGKWAVIE